MSFDYSKVRGRIKEVFGSQRAFASCVGRSGVFVSRVLNNKALLNQHDIEEWATALRIESCDLGTYFFVRKVCETKL